MFLLVYKKSNEDWCFYLQFIKICGHVERTSYCNILNAYVTNDTISASISLFKWKYEFPTEWWLQILKFCPAKPEIKETKMAM